MRIGRTSWTLLGLLAAACAPGAAPDAPALDAPAPREATADAEIDTTDSLEEPGDRPRLHPRALGPRVTARPELGGDEAAVAPYTGAVHRIPIRTADGVREVSAIEIDGDLVFEGDIILGKKADLIPTLPSGARGSTIIADVSARWPDAVIPFTIDAAVTDVDRIYAAMDLISERTPVRFVPYTNEVGYLKFIVSTEEGVSRAEMGYKGREQITKIWPTHSPGVIAHELLHALGVWHEHTRPDRNDYVVFDPACVKDGYLSAFDIPADPVVLADHFDFDSIMLYSSTQFSDGCPTMVRKSDGTTFAKQREKLSNRDINGLYLAYGQALGNIESDDRFGETVAVGDFDDDGYQDLAVGAPGEAPGSDPAAGVVFLYKGTAHGLAPWTWLSQETRHADGSAGLGVNEAGDQFGAALTVGDFDHDGVDDLAIGAPGEDVGSIDDAGAVFVYTGFRNVTNEPRFGLQPFVTMTQGNHAADADEQNDHFGTALAAGDYDHDGDDDLAVGAPDETVTGGPLQSGAVYAFKGGATGFAFWKMLDQTGLDRRGVHDAFGATLATGDLDGDARDDLVVGAPQDVGSGAVYLYRGGSSAAGQLSPWARFTQSALQADEAGDDFGASLATGDLDGDGKAELVVGAPGDVGGRMFLFRGANPPTAWRTFTQSPMGADEDGDLLGTAAVIGNLTGNGAQLAVGAPREVVGNGQRSGAMYLWRNAQIGAVTPWMNRTQEQLDADEVDDRFGSAMAIGLFGGHSQRQLVVGAYGEKLTSTLTGQTNRQNAGAVYTYGYNGSTVVGRMMITQETFGKFFE